MNVRSAFFSFSLIVLPAIVYAQGFAGLGQGGEGYALPDPDTRFVFPEDHGSHPDFRIEWWYVTANLFAADGTPYGIQWTLFRNALRPGGAEDDQAWMAHAAVSTPDGHLYAERFARGGIGQAGVSAQPFDAFIDEWQMSGPTLSDVTLVAQSDVFRYELSMVTDAPFVNQGQSGYSVKSSSGQASHYYSQPFYTVEGTLFLPNGPVEVSGQAWLDREWSSQPLAETQSGWDWVSLHFKTGDKLMGFRLRDDNGSSFIAGTWIEPDGTPTPLENGALTMKPMETSDVANRTVPTAWNIALPDKKLDIRVTAIYPDSWMGTLVPYWEGPLEITGSHPGHGYLEMSGY